MTLVMIPKEELDALKKALDLIFQQLQSLREQGNTQPTAADYIPAAQFMKAVNIGRTKFYELIGKNKIQTLKKCRHTYVLASEVKRYFIDPTIR